MVSLEVERVEVRLLHPSFQFERRLTRTAKFLREQWALYGVGAVILLMRFAVRIRMVGFKGFQGDDYMSILVLALFTMDASTVQIISHGGTNVEASVVQKTRPLTATEIDMFTRGSKEQLAGEYSYTTLIWAMKGTMLFFFDRLTLGLGSHRYVKWLGIACGVSYVAVILTVTFGWSFLIPASGPDIGVNRKLVVAILLCSGLFVICAALVRVVLILEGKLSSENMNRWGIRETIVGIITINLPILKPLFNKSFWSSGTSSLSHGTSRNPDTGTYELSTTLTSKARGDHAINWNEGARSAQGTIAKRAWGAWLVARSISSSLRTE
ncbi:hypothetical protein LARI1_G001875 [Lachnellula arida]|uniref:Uncharacterized protein n=1 Tax=Lachnellula arida TaxID=1316785 RepID=A0A8T9BJ51_9HELO|nr:hypothetical protein LARI1_G001875 [Lachnellula arida]